MANREVIADLVAQVSLDGTKFNQGMGKVSRELKTVQEELKTARSRFKQTGDSTDFLGSKSRSLSNKLRLQKSQVDLLGKSYNESRKNGNEFSKNTQNLARRMEKAKREISETEHELEDVNNQLKNQPNRWQKLGESAQTAGQKMMTAGQSMSRAGRTMTMGVTTPLLGIAGAAIKVASDFEEGMSEVQAKSGATGEQLEKLEKQARGMGKTTRFSATEASQGMTYLAQAGFEVEDIMKTMPGLLDLAAASNMDLGRAADIASNILTGFNIKAEDSGRISDVLAEASSSANTNVEQLGGAMKYVAPVASTLNVSLEGTTAAIGKMSDAGIQGEKAGRQLRQGMLRLAKPTGEAASLIEELGIKVFDAEGNMKSMPNVVEELNGGLEGMESDARAAALATIFGSESTAGWSKLLDTGSDDLRKYTEELNNAEGAASEMADVMNDNAKGSMREFKSAMEDAGIEAAEHLMPVFTDMVEGATELFRKFGDLEESTQKNIIKMGGFAAAAGPASVVLGGLTTTAGGLTKGLGGVANMLGKKSGAGLLGRIAGLSRGGVAGLAIGGVAALGTGIYTMTKNTERSIEETLNMIETRKKEIDATDKLIDAYEGLRRKNKLTNDEMLRYMDIVGDLEGAKSEDVIKGLTKEQEKLLKKSGLTNDEMNEFLDLNDKVIEKSPKTTQVVSEQGNAYAGVADELKKLNEKERERLAGETQNALSSELIKQRDRLAEQKNLQTEISGLEKQRDEKLQGLIDRQDKLTELSGHDYRIAKKLLDADRVSYDKLLERIEGKKESLKETEKELKRFDQLKGDYAQMVLYEQGIVSEKGKANNAIRTEQKEINKARSNLERLNDTGEITKSKYRQQNDKLNEQQRKLDAARSKLVDMNNVADRTIYKDLNIIENPSISWLDRALGKDAYKTVHIRTLGLSATDSLYKGALGLEGHAAGTHDNPGGMSMLGGES